MTELVEPPSKIKPKTRPQILKHNDQQNIVGCAVVQHHFASTIAECLKINSSSLTRSANYIKLYQKIFKRRT